MASNRPTPHGPSTYGLGGPADFSGAVGFGAPVGPAGPSGAGAPVQPAQVPPIAGGLREGQPPQEPFSRDLSHGQASPAPQNSPPHHRSAQGVLPGDAPSPGLEGEGEVRGEGDGTGDAWLPADESSDDDGPLRALRGKHRVARARSGGLARGGTALGVGVIAAVGASGVAAAQGRPPVPISMPDPGGAADGDGTGQETGTALAASAGPSVAPSRTGTAPDEAAQDARPAGAAEALRNRILQQADVRQDDAPQADAPQDAAEPEAGTGAEHAAAPQADQGAPGQQGAAEQAGTAEERTEAAPPAAQGTAPRATAADAPATPAADHRAHPTRTFVAPVSSYTLAAGFGQADDRWAADHTGQDFTAPTGTLVKAVHDGTITQAGWAGGYGYRIVLTLDDGTQLWFCHLSSMVKTTGRVHTGDVIGRVGATGNATGPHLHLEVRPDAGAPTDPVSWLRDRGTTV
ncbi:peptidoglycan DD-metalloendopeptidase family protein [Streptomyces noursei]|uniref:peptidoglycan DD-metalloendopeptidase family protein n=1 Tax=Streptomyces noursei TaxID=1971 RepID=UPI0033C78CCE